MRKTNVLIPDKYLLTILLGLLSLSFVVLYSATHKITRLGLVEQYAMKQLIYMGVGLTLMFIVAQLDYRKLGMLSGFIYVAGIIGLITVLVIGHKISGAKRWITLGPLTIQPSEIMKLITVFALAWYLDTLKGEKFSLRHLFMSAVIIGMPMFLIMIEPDLGTALIFVPIFFMMLYVAGAPLKYLIIMALTAILCSPFSWLFLKGYQKQRILTFLNPYNDQFGAGWPIIQSKIAIGSGRFFGKGFMQGTQSQLDFLPERHTDFIFSVLGEEWGFLGSLILFGLFFLLLTRFLTIADNTRDMFGKLVIVGITTILFFQFVVNIGMTFGFLPVTGLPLPFFSYGGSSLVSLLIALGLVQSIARNVK